MSNSPERAATADELDTAADTGVIPEWFRPIDKEAVRLLREHQ